MVILKEAEYRHAEGKRIAEVTLHTDDLSTLPTDAADIEGLLDDDVLGEGSVALDITSGAVAMFSGESWYLW